MNTPTKFASEAVVVGVANATTWGLQDVSLASSVLLAFISVVWILAQTARFLQKWGREEEERNFQLKIVAEERLASIKAKSFHDGIVVGRAAGTDQKTRIGD